MLVGFGWFHVLVTTDWPAGSSKVNNKSQHSSFVWDPSSFYTKAEKFHL